MTTTFRTEVLYLPPTPLGLLPGRWAMEHHCTICRVKVATDDLTSHAQEHVAVTSRRNTTGSLTINTAWSIIARSVLVASEVVPCHWRNDGPIVLAGDI